MDWLRSPEVADRCSSNFTNPAHVAGLARSGYVEVPFLTCDELRRVRQVRERHGPAPGDPRTGFHSDAWSCDVNYKRLVGGELAAELRGPIARLTIHHRMLAVAHVVKWPGPEGSVVAHRDPTFVDERRHRSVSVWCPLEDVEPGDGSLWVVPGSHRLSTGTRVHDGPDNLFSEVDDNLEQLAVPLALPAGAAVIFDHALIHRSGPNSLRRERTAVVALLVPHDARTQYALSGPDGTAEVIEIGPEFFIENRLSDLDVPGLLASYPHVQSGPRPDHRPSFDQLLAARTQR